MTVRVEFYGDVLCPWCYIGKRRLAKALDGLGRPGGGAQPEIVWRSYELDPGAGPEPGPSAAEAMEGWWGDRAAGRVAVIESHGLAEGLELDLRRARPVSTFDAHRLLQYAAGQGLAEPAWERLLRAYHTEGRDVADHRVLTELGAQAGLEAAGVRRVLGGDAYAREVRADRRRAAELGVRGVPSLVVDGRPPVSGVQPPERLRALLAYDRDRGRRESPDAP